MNNLFNKIIFGFTISVFSLPQAFFLAAPSDANPQKNCLPVARSLKTKKPYCAHELQGLKQSNAQNQNSGILCFIVNKIIPLNQFLSLDQCISKDSAYQFDSKGQRIVPKIKGAKTKLTILQPLGNTVITSQPDVAWQPIPNAGYRVTLTQGGKGLWSETTRESSLRIQRPLSPGTVHTINVVALVDDLPVSEDSKALKLADPAVLQGIDQTVNQVHGRSRDPLTKGIDKALLLYHSELWDAAVQQLKALMPLQEPEVYHQLALIYQESGQGDLATEYRQKAVELANRKNKPLSQN